MSYDLTNDPANRNGKSLAQIELGQKADELNGSEIRMRRYIPEEQTARFRREQRQKALTQQLTQWQLLQQNPAYLHVCDLVDQAQSKLDDAIGRNSEAQERLLTLIEELKDSAAKLSDGRSVFPDEDGTLRLEDGSILQRSDVPVGLKVPKEATRWHELDNAQTALTAARKKGAALADIQDRQLNPIRDRLQDQDDPVTDQEIESLTKDAEKAVKDIEALETASPAFTAAASIPAEERVAKLDISLTQYTP